MKINYHGYCIQKLADSSKHHFNLHDFLSAFCGLDNLDLKNSFLKNGENLYIFKSSPRIFLFMITRSQEFIKKISSSNLSVSEIYSMLSGDEMLGFASYVYIEKGYVGFASTVMAPKISSFANFMNQIFDAIGIKEYSFVIVPFLQESTRSDLLKKPVLGRSEIQINQSNTQFDNFRELLGGTADEFADVDSFEIIIKPRRRKNIEKAVKRTINSISGEGVDKFLVRGRDQDSDLMIDYYLEGKGLINDVINTKDESEIPGLIQERVSKNSTLKEKATKHLESESIKNDDVSSISDFYNVSSWPVGD